MQNVLYSVSDHDKNIQENISRTTLTQDIENGASAHIESKRKKSSYKDIENKKIDIKGKTFFKVIQEGAVKREKMKDIEIEGIDIYGKSRLGTR